MPGVTDVALRERVRADYGLEVETLEAVSAGASGRVWRATVGPSAYAVRWTCAASAAPHVALALARTEPLRPASVVPAPAHVAPPVLTRTGSTDAVHAGGRLSVEPWLDGPTGRDVALSPPQWTAFGRLVARVHAIDPASVPGLPRERFDAARACAALAAVEHAIERCAAADPLAHAVVEAWQVARHRVGLVADRAVRVSGRLRARRHDEPLVVCHGDAHVGHVVATGPRDVALLDWERARLAPPEADLMFVLGGVLPHVPVTAEQAAAFFTGYGRVDIDDDRLVHVRCVRAVQDVVAAATVALDPARAPARRVAALGDLAAHLGSAGVVAAALE